MRVLLSVRPGGFTLNQDVLKTLFAHAPHYFDEPLELSDFTHEGKFDFSAWPNAVVHEGQLYFLMSHSAQLRCDPHLLAQFDARGSEGLCGPYCSQLKAVEVPDDARWHIFEYEDGSEAVHEDHRVWC